MKEILNPKGIINFENPRILLCSMQYPNDAVGATVQYFIELYYDGTVEAKVYKKLRDAYHWDK
ncbi:hypothetical protein [Fischerella thermalis]|uniref:hypothetical protein n=1 Tax=Fischerella thermalis TaxID=372787 RepID=UPI0019FE8CBF|nr:hypothetical protein [Fischerella thermalis]MBF1989842.1 hypothetical protein [Fischerella thermalis M58_A2018_009]MBF2061145.1 hypothetical protein [Fischerella thermalis M66_A2018_004]